MIRSLTLAHAVASCIRRAWHTDGADRPAVCAAARRLDATMPPSAWAGAGGMEEGLHIEWAPAVRASRDPLHGQATTLAAGRGPRRRPTWPADHGVPLPRRVHGAQPRAQSRPACHAGQIGRRSRSRHDDHAACECLGSRPRDAPCDAHLGVLKKPPTCRPLIRHWGRDRLLPSRRLHEPTSKPSLLLHSFSPSPGRWMIMDFCSLHLRARTGAARSEAVASS